VEQAYKLCLLGATEERLADFFGVTTSTITNWKNTHPEFLAALKEGKDEADSNVAKSLYRRAMGYEHKAVKIVADAKTGTEHIVEYVERYPPDTTACIFWLKNRQRKDWRDRQELTGKDGDPIQQTVVILPAKRDHGRD
jgi:TPP-dependent trihydroxycyclohexane-1,2-dione (THcHDO) dehydratase